MLNFISFFLKISCIRMASFSSVMNYRPTSTMITVFMWCRFTDQYACSIGVIYPNSLAVIYNSLDWPSQRRMKEGIIWSLATSSPWRNSRIFSWLFEWLEASSSLSFYLDLVVFEEFLGLGLAFGLVELLADFLLFDCVGLSSSSSSNSYSGSLS
jgi:hypothetical protein